MESVVRKATELARELVIASDLQLSPQEIAIVREKNPRHRIYPLAGNYADGKSMTGK